MKYEEMFNNTEHFSDVIAAKQMFLKTCGVAEDAVERLIAMCDREMLQLGLDPSLLKAWELIATSTLRALIAEEKAEAAEARIVEAEAAEAQLVKAKAETRWVCKKFERRGILLRMSLSHCETETVYEKPWAVDIDSVFEGFEHSVAIESLCVAAWERIKLLWSKHPPSHAGESTSFRPLMKQIFQEISEAAQQLNFTHLKMIDEYDQALEYGMQPMDFCCTLPNEDWSTHSNCMFYVKVTQEDDNAARSEELLRGGLLQAIRRLIERHDVMSNETTHGIAMVTNGTNAIFVRLGLLEDMPDADETTWFPHPCFISPALSFCFDTSSEVCLDALPAECPIGLRLLIQLLCYAEQDHASLFGLPPCSGMPQCIDKYEYVNTLGHGSFATVCRVRAKESGVKYACKFAGNDENDARIQHEHDMLQYLAANGVVKGVPKVVDFYRGLWNHPRRENERYALILADVGIPSDVYTPYSELETEEDRHAVDFLSHFMTHRDTAQDRLHQLCQMRMEYGERVFSETRAVLKNLREIGVVHGDVRPPNILIKEHRPVDAVAGAGVKPLISDLQIILSDFGEAEILEAANKRKAGSSELTLLNNDNGGRRREDVDDSPKETGFPAVHALFEEDEDALLDCYVAITFGRRGQPPWVTSHLRGRLLMERDRCTWLVDVLQPHLSTLYPKDGVLCKTLKDFCNKAALQKSALDATLAAQQTAARGRPKTVLADPDVAPLDPLSGGAGK